MGGAKLFRSVAEIVLQLMECRVSEEKLQVPRACSVMQEMGRKSTAQRMHSQFNAGIPRPAFHHLLQSTARHAATIFAGEPESGMMVPSTTEFLSGAGEVKPENFHRGTGQRYDTLPRPLSDYSHARSS